MKRNMKCLRASAVTALAVAVYGCEAADKVVGRDEQPEFSGTYVIISLDGKALPAVAEETSAKKREVLASAFVFKADGTYDNSFTIRETAKPSGSIQTFTRSCSGTYTRTGNLVNIRETFVSTLSECSGHTTTATWSNGNTLTFMWDGLAVVARK